MPHEAHVTIVEDEASRPAPTDALESPATAPVRENNEDVWVDIWDAAGDDHESRETADIHRLRTTHTTAGYREGLAAAREAEVQVGFDEGYLLGAAIGLRAGYLRGVLDGLQAGLDGTAVEASTREAWERAWQQIREDLHISNLLSAQYIGDDATWRWPMEQQEPTMAAIADAHPVLQRAHQLVYSYASQLGVERAPAHLQRCGAATQPSLAQPAEFRESGPSTAFKSRSLVHRCTRACSRILDTVLLAPPRLCGAHERHERANSVPDAQQSIESTTASLLLLRHLHQPATDRAELPTALLAVIDGCAHSAPLAGGPRSPRGQHQARPERAPARATHPVAASVIGNETHTDNWTPADTLDSVWATCGCASTSNAHARETLLAVYSYITPDLPSALEPPNSPQRYDLHEAHDPPTTRPSQRQQQPQEQPQLSPPQPPIPRRPVRSSSSTSLHTLRRTPKFDEGHARPRAASVGRETSQRSEGVASATDPTAPRSLFQSSQEAESSTSASVPPTAGDAADWPPRHAKISKRTATAILFALEKAIRAPYPFTADSVEENASMADISGGSRTQNGGARPVPVVGTDHIGRTVTPPTVIMRMRQEREEKRARDEARRREQEEAERRRRSAERRAAQVAAANAAGVAEGGVAGQDPGGFRRAPGRRSMNDPAAPPDEFEPRPTQRGSGGEEQSVPQTYSQAPDPSSAPPRRHAGESSLPQPTGISRTRPGGTSNPQPRPVPPQQTRTRTATTQQASTQSRISSGTGAANRTAPTSTSTTQPQAQPTNSQPRNNTTSTFPHAFERWEQLSAHWEGLTSYWIRRLEGNSEEISRQPLNQQLSRQVTDLSAAGANLFHAVVELQRLRASSERKFQRWFAETQTEQKRSLDRISQLEAELDAERDGRSREVRNETRAEADRLRIEEALSYRRLADDQMKEMKRELQISRDEARRGWEEIGRMEQAERDRTYSLKRGKPTLVGGVQVVPMAQTGTSRPSSSSRERPSGGEGGHGSGGDHYAGVSYDGARSDTDTDPYIEPSPAPRPPPVPQIPPSINSTIPPQAAAAPAAAPFYQQRGTRTALHSEDVPRTGSADDISEDDYELDEHGRVLLDAQGYPITAPRRGYTAAPGQGYGPVRYPVSSAPAAPMPPTSAPAPPAAVTRYEASSTSNGSSSAPDYEGHGYGWEAVAMHQHPTRLSDVLEEEDERSRTSPSRASERSRGLQH